MPSDLVSAAHAPLRWAIAPARWAIAPVVMLLCVGGPAGAQENLPWQSADHEQSAGYGAGSTYNNGPVVRNAPHVRSGEQGQNGSANTGRAGENGEYYEQLPPSGGQDDAYRAPRQGYDYEDRNGRGQETYRDGPDVEPQPGTYSQGEIKSAGHKFFGSISQGLASVIEYAFSQSGRPNGYILGEDAGGAFVAGLRYGEGRLYTRDAGTHRVYWQGPSIGYDFGGEGSKTMILVYNLRDPSQIYHRFGGVQGSAYFVGGVSIQFQKYGDVVLAPIRSGVGLRLGANVGYLKYTRSPTWNPF